MAHPSFWSAQLMTACRPVMSLKQCLGVPCTWSGVIFGCNGHCGCSKTGMLGENAPLCRILTWKMAQRPGRFCHSIALKKCFRMVYTTYALGGYLGCISGLTVGEVKTPGLDGRITAQHVTVCPCGIYHSVALENAFRMVYAAWAPGGWMGRISGFTAKKPGFSDPLH